VVASEVRSLGAAQRLGRQGQSRTSSTTGVAKVGEGSRLVSESGQHLGEIVASVQESQPMWS